MTQQPVRVLLVEDDEVDRIAFERMCRTETSLQDLHMATCVAEALAVLPELRPDVVVTDYNLGDGTAFDLRRGLEQGTPMIIITGAGSQSVAIQAIRAGAFDYLIKDNRGEYLRRLPAVIESAVASGQARRQVRMLSQALMCIRDAVYVVGSDRRILFANSAFVEKYGCENPVGELVGDVYEELSPPYAPGDELGIGVSSYESVEHATRSGVRSHVLKSSSSVLDSQGKEIGQVVVIRDISEIVRTSELLREYATIDDMTQTMSRPFGRMLLEKQMALALRSGQPLTVCYVDIDDLKIVNDTFGHGEGDSYITLVTQALTGATRLSDSVCRLGGDEFLMILPECSLDEARTMWGRVLMTFEAANKSGSKPYLISVSHGFAQFDHTAHPTPDQLISQADASMYADKLSKSAMNPKPRGPGDSDGPSA